MNWKKTVGCFALGAAGYPLLELLWRGRTHWSMGLTGGAVLCGLLQLRRRLAAETPFGRCVAGAALVTTAEYLVGQTVNRHYRLHVWDYTAEPLNVDGQICARYALLWLALCAPLMLPQIGLYKGPSAEYNNGGI